MAAYCVVFVTAPAGHSAKSIAEKIVRSRLAACANSVPAVSSIYWWKGRVESAEESLLIIKTRRSLLAKLTAFIKKIHPYDVPEVIALPILKGNAPYLRWIRQETR